ncbi:hypothetical protein ACFQ6C_26225 [Streptomyces sp. NPDC056454]|uniref:hypothetical protein n=1 Tax=Streptomyces sp. NPDC056454 TaxID=3345823 RepID=UPI0036C1E30F
MERCHLYLPLVDSSGATYSYAEVTLVVPETGKPIDEPVYLQPHGGAPQTWPILLDPAVVDLWTDRPLRVTVQAALPGGATLTRSGMDILPAPSATVKTTQPLQIGSADGLDGQALLAVSPDGTASWQVLDGLRTHRHSGNAPGSTVLGPAQIKDIYPQQTWLGAPGTGTQGERSSVLGGEGVPDGTESTAVGRGTASDRAVAIGAASSASADTVAVSPGSTAGKAGQVVVGRNSSAAPGGAGGVVIGSGVTAATGNMIRLQGALTETESGTVILGQGTLPDLSWLQGAGHTVLLGSVVASRYLGVRGSAILGGAGGTVGVFGGAGSARPFASTAGIISSTPGRYAALSLMYALDRLGLIYLLDGAVDDELADWSKTFEHNANMVLETGDSNGSKGGDLSRAKRNGVGEGTVTYRTVDDLRDFTARIFTWSQVSNPANHTNEITAYVSTNNATWTPVPLAWQPVQATAADWGQTWVSNARPLPAGMKYLQLRVNLNSQASTPQIGRVIVRTAPTRNLALNPSLTNDLSNTQSFGASVTRARVTNESRVSPASVRHINDSTDMAGSTWSIEPVRGGGWVQVSAWVKIPSTTTVTSGLISWLTEDNTVLQTKELLPLGTPNANGWVFVAGSYLLTAGQTCSRIGLSFETNSGGTWYADVLMVERGSTLHSYVDGAETGCVWEGEPHASTSRRL